MLTKNINFKNFIFNKSKAKIFQSLKRFLKEENQILNSLKDSYQNSYNKKSIIKFNNFKEIVLIGMGGSILGSKAIYNFLRDKIKKNFYFIDTFQFDNSKLKKKKIKFNYFKIRKYLRDHK